MTNLAPSFRKGCESLERFGAKNETRIVGAILAGFLAVCLCVIRNHGWQGQDFFTVHSQYTERYLTNPGVWFYRAVTDRPLIYWIGVVCLKLAPGDSGYMLASILCAIFGAAALFFMHAASRRFIHSPLLRCSALTLMAFLPVTIITTVVYAGDTVALLPFALGGWSLAQALEATTHGRTFGYAALAGLALSVGNYGKATFLVLPAAVLTVVIVFLLWKQIMRPKAVLIVLLCSLVPAMVAMSLVIRSRREVQIRHPSSPKWLDRHRIGEMTWRSILFPYPNDVRIFSAPGFWDRASDGSLPLIKSNSYSYPALLHLAIFTDVLGLTNIDRTASGAHRPEPQKIEARLAVCWGLFFSLPTVAAVLASIIQLGSACIRRIPPSKLSLVVWLLFALFWYVPMVSLFPYVANSYRGGYWLPRLTLPAMWCFFLMLFAAADALPPRWRRPAPGILALLVAIQTSLDITSIWF